MPYLSMNCTSFSFYSWFQPFTIKEEENNLFYPWDDLGIINYSNSLGTFSLSYWLDCVDNYYRCAASFIRNFYIPYLYRCKYLYYDQNDLRLEITYPEVLQGTTTFSCQLPEDKSRIGLFYIISRLSNAVSKNYSYYYLEGDSFYLNVLPISPLLIDPDTELTNTQYELSDDIYLVINTNFRNYTYTPSTYRGFRLCNEIFLTGSNVQCLGNSYLTSTKGLKLFYKNEEGYSDGLKGRISLDFSNLFENVSNRFAGYEYNIKLFWKTSKGDSGKDFSRLKSHYIFVKGPNTVIYLRGIGVRK